MNATEYSSLGVDATMLIRTAAATVRDEAIDLLRWTDLLAFIDERLGPTALATDDELEFITSPAINVHVSLNAADRQRFWAFVPHLVAFLELCDCHPLRFEGANHRRGSPTWYLGVLFTAPAGRTWMLNLWIFEPDEFERRHQSGH